MKTLKFLTDHTILIIIGIYTMMITFLTIISL